MANKKRFLLIFLFLCMLSGLLASEAAAPCLDFKWALLILQDDKQVIDATEQNNILLDSGCGFKFFFHPEAPAWFYIFHYNSENEVTLLFSHAFDDYKEGLKYLIPTGEGWYGPTGEPGEETFFIITVLKPLNTIVNYYETYRKSLQAGKEVDIKKNKRVLLDALYSIQTNDQFSAETIRKSVPIAGSVRNYEGINALQIVGGEKYARIIQIHHHGD